MHEASLVQNMLTLAQRALNGRGDGAVTKVTISVGALSNVLPGALTFAFEAMKTGTRFEKAELIIEDEPAGAVCDECGREFYPEKIPFICPACGSGYFTVVRGEDTYLKSIEMEEK